MRRFIGWVVALMMVFGVGAYFSDKHLNTDILANIGINVGKKEEKPTPPIVVEKTYSIIFINKTQPSVVSHKENAVIDFITINDIDFLGWSKSNNINDLITDLGNETATKTTVYFAMYKEQTPVVESSYTIVFINKDNAKISSVLENNKIAFENIEDENFLGWSKTNSVDDLIVDLNNEVVTQNTVYFAVYNELIETPTDKMVVTYVFQSDVLEYGSVLLEKGVPVSLDSFKSTYKNKILNNYNYIPQPFLDFNENIVVEDFNIVDLFTNQKMVEINTNETTQLVAIQPVYKLSNYHTGIIIRVNGEVDKVIKTSDNITYDSLGNTLETNYNLSQVKDGYYVYNDVEHMSIWDLFSEDRSGVNINPGLHVINIQLQEELYRVDNIVVKNLLGQEITIPYAFEAKDSFDIYQEIQHNVIEKFSSVVGFALNFKLENQLFLGNDYNSLWDYKFENFTGDFYDREKNTAYLTWDFDSAFNQLNGEEEFVKVRKIATTDINGNYFEISADLKFSNMEDLNTIFQMETQSLTIEDFARDYGIYQQLFGIGERNFVFKNNNLYHYFGYTYDIQAETIRLIWDPETYIANIETNTITLKLESLNGQAHVTSSAGFGQIYEEAGIYSVETLKVSDLRIYVQVTPSPGYKVTNIMTYSFNGGFEDELKIINPYQYYVQYRNFTEDFTIEVIVEEDIVNYTVSTSNLIGSFYMDQEKFVDGGNLENRFKHLVGWNNFKDKILLKTSTQENYNFTLTKVAPTVLQIALPKQINDKFASLIIKNINTGQIFSGKSDFHKVGNFTHGSTSYVYFEFILQGDMTNLDISINLLDWYRYD